MAGIKPTLEDLTNSINKYISLIPMCFVSWFVWSMIDKGTRKPNKEYATMKETVCHSPVIDMFLIWQKMTRLPN